jgi:hypothetical protein
VNVLVRVPRVAALCLALLGLACGDAPTATNDRATGETLVVSVHGIAREDAGMVLRLSSVVQTIEPARASLEIGWATDETGGTTVVVIGTLSDSSDLLLVRRSGSAEPLRAHVIEVAGAEGELSLPSSVRPAARPVP